MPFKWNNEDRAREPALPVTPGCSCDTPQPCNTGRQWTKEHDAIEIAAEDAISDNGQEIYNLLQARRIDNVIIMGVHTNVCVLGRPFGIRQMVYLGKNVVLCRDLTDTYHRDPGRHFQGLEQVIEHVERTGARQSPAHRSRASRRSASWRTTGAARSPQRAAISSFHLRSTVAQYSEEP